MKLFIASDIHGDAVSAGIIAEAYKKSGADRLVLLGDLLYHGPRNDLPAGYAPKEVIKILNSLKNDILAVRGNCDTEVDQMVLEFPVLADYAFIECNGLSLFVTHGHKFNTDNPPPMKKGDILLHGHTHVSCAVEFGNNNLYVNPGSASIPKENTPKGYIILSPLSEGSSVLYFMTLDGEVYKQVTVKAK